MYEITEPQTSLNRPVVSIMSSTANSPLAESPDALGARDVIDQRHRKSVSSTGGGRAWSSQEVGGGSPCVAMDDMLIEDRKPS